MSQNMLATIPAPVVTVAKMAIAAPQKVVDHLPRSSSTTYSATVFSSESMAVNARKIICRRGLIVTMLGMAALNVAGPLTSLYTSCQACPGVAKLQ